MQITFPAHLILPAVVLLIISEFKMTGLKMSTGKPIAVVLPGYLLLSCAVLSPGHLLQVRCQRKDVGLQLVAVLYDSLTRLTPSVM